MIHTGDGFKALAAMPANSATLVFVDPDWGIGLRMDHAGTAKAHEAAQECEKGPMFWNTTTFEELIADGLAVAPHVLLKLSGRPEHVRAIFSAIGVCTDFWHEYGVDYCEREIGDADLAYWFTWDKGPGAPPYCNDGIAENRETIWWFTRDGKPQRDGDWPNLDSMIRIVGDDAPGDQKTFGIRRVRDADRLSKHVCEMPLALCEKIIKCWTKKGDLIIDPCCGSGALLTYAHALGRRVLGYEINPAMAEQARAALACGGRTLVTRHTAELFREGKP